MWEKNNYIEMRHTNGKSLSGYYNFSYQIYFYYFKNYGGIKYCSLMGAIDYDKNGKVLDNYSWNNFDWQRIVPGTTGESMYNAAWARVRGK